MNLGLNLPEYGTLYPPRRLQPSLSGPFLQIEHILLFLNIHTFPLPDFPFVLD